LPANNLKKLPDLIEGRLRNIEYLTNDLNIIPCLEPARIRPECKHVFYVHPIKFNVAVAGIHRDRYVEAVKAELMPTELRESEGINVGCGYAKPLYLQPLYKQRIAFGNKGCPWSCDKYLGNIDYSKGICPVTENMYEDVLITHELMRPGMTEGDLDDVVSAFKKVWENRVHYERYAAAGMGTSEMVE